MAAPRQRTIRPALELLEDRTTPGVVTVAFAFGTLSLIGSAGGDTVTLDQPATGQLRLTGNATTSFRYAGVNLAGPLTFGSPQAPVKSLHARLGLGNDQVIVNQATPIALAGNVALDLGSGANSLQAAGGQFFTVGGNLVLRAGAGSDTVQLADFNVAGNLTLDLGDGANQVALSRTAVPPNNTVGGQLTIASGVGAEVISVADTDVTGLTTITTGRGNLVTGVNAQVTVGAAGRPMDLAGGLRVISSLLNTGTDQITLTDNSLTIGGRGLTILTGQGNDTVTLGGLVNAAGTVISTGAGDDALDLVSGAGGSTYAGPFLASTGAGNDTLNVASAGPIDFLSLVRADLGAGNDQLNLAAGGAVNFAGLAVFDGGAGPLGGFNQRTVTLANLQGSVTLPRLLNLL
jgi:hypothetical protein